MAESLKSKYFQRLEYCGARRAPLRPYFFRSLILGFQGLSSDAKNIDLSRLFAFSFFIRYQGFSNFCGCFVGVVVLLPHCFLPAQTLGFRVHGSTFLTKNKKSPRHIDAGMPTHRAITDRDHILIKQLVRNVLFFIISQTNLIINRVHNVS